MEKFVFVAGLFLQLIALIFTSSFIFYAWRKREMIGSLSFMLWIIAIDGWLITNILTVMSISGSMQLIMYRLILLFQAVLPGTFLLFTLHFSGQHRWVTSWRQIYLFVFPLIIVYFGWTHPFRDGIWGNYFINSVDAVTYRYGWFYILLWIYFFICLSIATLILINFIQYRGNYYKDQIRLIILSALFPAGFVLTSIFWPSRVLINHILPISFSISGLLIGFTIYKYHLFDLPMVTYHTLLENFQDGIIIFDQKLRLIFANLTAEKLLLFDSSNQIGKHVSQIIQPDSEWFPVLNKDTHQTVLQTKTGENFYDVQHIFLPDQENRWKQKLIIIRDVTQTHISEQAEKEARLVAEIRAMELDVLRNIAEKLNRLADFDQVIHEGLQEIVLRLGARFGYVVLVNNRHRPYTAGTYNLPPTVDLAFKKHVFCPSCKIFENFMSGMYQEPVSFLPCAVLDQYSISYPGLISIPLRLAERQIGVLNLVMAPNAVFSGDEIRLLQTIGDQYSASIERARLYEEAEKMATIDPLTELFNRRYFFELAQQEFDRACRYKHHISVIMLDIDLFKNVNDTYGHLVGDHVLKNIADRCRSVLRVSDKIGRYGGEEFVILLPETSLEMAEKTAIRIRAVVSERPVIVDYAKILITVSLGVSSMDSDCNLALEQVFEQADQAMYRAKLLGRNRVHVWNDPFVVEGLFNKK